MPHRCWNTNAGRLRKTLTARSYGKVVCQFPRAAYNMDWLYQEPTAERCEALIARMRADNQLLITDLRRTKNYI